MSNLFLLLIGIVVAVVSCLLAGITGSYLFVIPSALGGSLIGYSTFELWFS